jgi:hypothetical protein
MSSFTENSGPCWFTYMSTTAADQHLYFQRLKTSPTPDTQTLNMMNICTTSASKFVSLYEVSKILRKLFCINKPKCIYMACVNHGQRNKIKFQDCEKWTKYTVLLSVCTRTFFSCLKPFQIFRGLSSGGIQSRCLPSWSKIHSPSVSQW